MAILRAQLQGKGRPSHIRKESGETETVIHGIYDGIMEQAGDLAEARTAAFDPGSLLYCLEGGGLYVKTSAGVWEEVQA